MMTQKKNPDVVVIARGKVGRGYGPLMGLLTMLKGLPLAYNKDLQDDKEGVFDVVKTLKKTLAVYSPMIKSIKINTRRLHEEVRNDYSNATQLANYLVIKGLNFREAHSITGQIVHYGINNQILLRNLTLAEYLKFFTLIDRDVSGIISIKSVIEKKYSLRGAAKKTVQAQLENAKNKLNVIFQWLILKKTIQEITL